ncbi:MAG: V-type ATP synthase subunit I [Clostridia bacterium]|nr:V-type ATP synthase subunit I [Clostridia bacterium]
MAIIEMRKVTVVADASSRDELLKLLIDSGAVEISDAEAFEGTRDGDFSADKETTQSGLSKLTFALDFLKKQRITAKKLVKAELLEYAPPKKGLLDPARPSVTPEAFRAAYDGRDRIFDSVRELERINAEQLTIHAELSRLNVRRNQLEVYASIDVPFSSFKDTKRTSFVLGTIPVERTEEVKTLLEEEGALCFIPDCDVTAKIRAISYIVPVEKKDSLSQKLSATDFSVCQFDDDYSAAEEIARIDEEAESKKRREMELLKESLTFDSVEFDIKTLYDYYDLEYKKAEASERFRYTRSTFALSCWTPAKSVEEIRKQIEKKGIVSAVFDEEPKEGDLVPTLTENNAIVSPYESVTNMYSVPSYKEKDPNAIMAFFYFVLFGVMLGDAAYGIILAVACFTLYILKKPRKGEGKMLLVIGMGGVSTAIWGALFGSWFGEKLVPIYWFSPLDNPLMMLGLSMGLGFLQIVVGMFLQAKVLFKQGKPLDAIFNVFGWYVVFAGLGAFAIAKLVVKTAPAWIATVGLALMITGVVMLLIGGGLGKKNVGAMILGGFKNIYGVTNILSDLLSYARLFGLGLATGVVAMVINQICAVLRTILGGHIVGLIVAWIISIVIYAVGHVFNIAINTLGTYVHNCRLQYVEFFGRFYEGGGHAFKAFGSDTKYVYLEKEQQVNN